MEAARPKLDFVQTVIIGPARRTYLMVRSDKGAPHSERLANAVARPWLALAVCGLLGAILEDAPSLIVAALFYGCVLTHVGARLLWGETKRSSATGALMGAGIALLSIAAFILLWAPMGYRSSFFSSLVPFSFAALFSFANAIAAGADAGRAPPKAWEKETKPIWRKAPHDYVIEHMFPGNHPDGGAEPPRGATGFLFGVLIVIGFVLVERLVLSQLGRFF